MADVTATFGSLSSTESSNSPAGATSVGTGLDENLRMMQAHQAAWRDQTAWGILTLASVSGTNTITATLASAGSVTFGPTALAANMKFLLVPANTNTGATTLNITSPSGGSALGAKSVFCNNAACVGGELRQNVPAIVEYDGTQFHIIANGAKVWPILATKQASTSGTAIDFTGIPSGVKRITIMFVGVSTNGTANLVVQIGDSGGIENTGYVSTAAFVAHAQAIAATNATTGYVVTNGLAAANVVSGRITLNLVDASTFTWVISGMLKLNTTDMAICAGDKSTSAELDRVRITTTNGTDAFDAGAINISFE
jgi:hypothetical protein